METGYWHKKWAAGDIGFHNSEANPLLTGHFPKLNLAKGSRVFLPLCGKTRDLAWLLANGYQVAGAELSQLAITELFHELGKTPNILELGDHLHYSADAIDIFVGNIFDLSAELLGPVDAVYDRAALVALPPDMRRQYTTHLTAITGSAPQLLISYEYDQTVIDGPPFSVSEEEVRQHYDAIYQVTPVEHKDVPGGLKGKVASTETVWLLQKRD